MKKQLLIILLLLTSISYATSLEDYVDTKQCDQIVDKQLYKSAIVINTKELYQDG